MTRLAVAVEAGLVLPDGPALVLRPAVGADLSLLPGAQVVQGFKPAYDHFTSLGFDTRTVPDGSFAVSMVCATRSKAETRALIAEAAARAPLVLVDGAKTDGIESHLRDVRRRAELGVVVSKAHGKLFSFTGGDFTDWIARPAQIDGMQTLPGVFSAEAVDAGSALLAAALPDKLPGQGADLGAGWGYLSRACLARDAVTALHLIEAECAALDCARLNITDPRATFHWADAASVTLSEPVDWVVMNPPFHAGRTAEPRIGQAFIAAAARLLGSRGRLFMVANRHLPYEQDVRAAFSQVAEIGGDARFKLILAEKPEKRAIRPSGQTPRRRAR